MIVADLSQVQVQEIILNEEEAKGKEFKSKSLTGKFPFLETEEGPLFESAAIARYFARRGGNSSVAGESAWEQAQIDQWIDFSTSSVLPHLMSIYRGTFHNIGDADSYNESVKSIKDSLKVLNTHLQGKDFLVGNKITVADVVVASHLLIPFQTALDAGFRKAMPNVGAWIERLIKNPSFVKRHGNIKLCQKVIKPNFPVKEQPKAAAKPAAKKEDDGEEKKEKKEADPLDNLPPSSLDLFNFKTFIVNHKDRKGEGMTWFFDNYDPEGYSLFHLQYEKYPGEGEVLYQTVNLMNGFLQRFDHFRKHAFAMHAVLGEEPNLEVQGVWLFRGKGIPLQMKDHPQFEYYKTRELDLKKEEDRQLVRDFWSAKPGEIVNGLKVQECKLHK